MVVVWYLLLLLVLLGGIVLAAFTLPGLWVMLGAAAIYAMLTHIVGLKTLLFLLVASLAGEILEQALGSAATKEAGGGKRAMIGGIIGGVVGGIFFTFIPVPVVSQIVGICLGSFAGAAAFELLGGERIPHALRVGAGAAKGRFLGILSKLCLAILAFFVTAIAAFP